MADRRPVVRGTRVCVAVSLLNNRCINLRDDDVWVIPPCDLFEHTALILIVMTPGDIFWTKGIHVC